MEAQRVNEEPGLPKHELGILGHSGGGGSVNGNALTTRLATAFRSSLVL